MSGDAETDRNESKLHASLVGSFGGRIMHGGNGASGD